jgi:NTE family protein
VGSKRTVSLVLGSGGARGHAHIGVIRAVEERGLEVRNIAGTSMGAVIGGIHAAGRLDTYQEWAFELTRSDVVKLLDLSFTWNSIFKGERIFEVLRELIGDRSIEDLDLGFVAVATDLDQQREVWLNEGPLFHAIRASSAVPGVFSPVHLDSRTLVDGGLVNPIPIAPTLNDSTDLTIAVNLNAMSDHGERESRDPGQRGDAGLEPVRHDPGHRERIARFIRDYLSSNGGREQGREELEQRRNASDILTESFDVMQGTIARMKLGAYAPDEVVNIPRQSCSFFEFDRAEELAEQGYERTCKVLDDLKL